MEKFDLIIIGLGPCGMRAAKRALKEGMSVLAFEKSNVGGTCLNLGCIPTKVIMHSSVDYYSVNNSSKCGITVKEAAFDFEKIVNRKNEIVQKLSKAAESELIKNGLKIIKEKAVIDFKNLSVNGFNADNIIIATGSKPYELVGLPFDGANILSSDDILNIKNLPKTVAIIGSGAIGIEWARILSNFGVNVSIIEKVPSLLPLMDIDIQKRITRIFKMKKINILTNAAALSYADGILKLDNGKEIQAEKILVAVGRKRNIIDGLEINHDLTTNYKNVYAAGDIAATKMLAHAASSHADYLIDKITGKNSDLPPDEFIPSVVYGEPEIASIGLNEQDIKNKDEYQIHNLPLTFLGKSWCDDKTDGFIKIITKDGLIKGAHIVSPEASSLIVAIEIMIKTNYKIDNINKIIFPHPTYSEGIFEVLNYG